jgi:hypothetical protein
MKRALAVVAVLSLGGFVASAQAADDASKSAATSSGCKVVQLKPGEQPPSGSTSSSVTSGGGGLSSSVTAGGGKVSGQTTGGNSITMHSGSGSASSSITTGTSSGDGSSTTVTNANGECTIYVNPGEKK